MATGTLQQPVKLDAQVLEIVRELLVEQGKERAAKNLTMHSSFQRDLGLASLDLVELVIRCETRLEIELPDEIAEQADTPAGWVRAIQQGSQETEAKSVYRIVPPSGLAPEAPHWAANIADVLRWHAESAPGRVHIHLIEEGAGQGITCAQLLESATTVARGLVAEGLRRNDRVAILLPNTADFFDAFFGIVLAGGIPVPLYPPASVARIAEYVHRQTALLRNVDARCLIGFDRVQAVSSLLQAGKPAMDVTTVDWLRRAGSKAPSRLPEPSEYALIQYTSGSTGEPKAATMTHASILANIRAIGKAVGFRGDDAVVSWLPLASDMGLVGCWLFSLYHGAPLTQMSPLEFQQRPESWFWAIHDSRGTLSAAPNFAFEHCTRRIPVWTLEGIDLSSWRTAVIAGEPVMPEIVERFSKRFAFTGLKREAITPCYGLAENSVALTIPPPVRGPVMGACGGFSVGAPLEGHEVRIVDAHGREVGEGVEGRLEFRGLSQFAGYWSGSGPVAPPEWIDSGDLAVRENGEIHITGRVKETILKDGRSLAPQFIESAVGEVPGVRAGAVTAIGVPDASKGSERLIVVAESGAVTHDDIARVKDRVLEVVAGTVGVAANEVLLIPPGTLPMTANIKQRRNTVRALYAAGEIGREPSAPLLQILGLRLSNLPALSARWSRRFLSATGNALLGAFAALAALAGGTLARLPGMGTVVGPAARLALRILGRAPQLAGHAPSGAAVIAANRCSRLDPLSLAAALPGRVSLCGEEALLEVTGWARFLLRPSVIQRQQSAEALRRGDVLVVLPDGPPGVPARRCRFRLEGFEAALNAQCPVIPASVVQIRGRTVIELANPLTGETTAGSTRAAVRGAIAGLHA